MVRGWATLLDGKTVEVATADGGRLRIQCENLLLAAGSEPTPLPSVPFGGIVVSSTEALSPDSIPKKLVVVGGGYIGLELGTVYRKLGAEVAVVEAQDRILPTYDAELTAGGGGARAHGHRAAPGRKVLGLNAEGNAVRLQDAAGAETQLAADRVLIAVGRRPRTQGWGLESLQLDRKGNALLIDDQCRTSMRDVGPSATWPANPCWRTAPWRRARWWPSWWQAPPLPAGRDPGGLLHRSGSGDGGPVAGRGRGGGLDCLVASFPFAANGRAMTLESTDGFVRRSRGATITWCWAGRRSGAACRNWRRRSRSRWRWAPRWKMWPAPSTPIPRWARRCRKRRSRRWATRCTSSASHCPYGLDGVRPSRHIHLRAEPST